MKNDQKTNGKPDCIQDFPATKNNSHDYHITKAEANTRNQIIEYNNKQADDLSWDLGALQHNMSSLDPVFNLLCFDLEKLDSEQLKSLIYCARDTLEKAIFDMSCDMDSVVKRFNNLFPEMAIVHKVEK
ncbi:MAG: hypothetical protein GX763_04225 [Clostridiaceae bacterium]|nr:hypothetical protein [Clostridiaceae bacterium]